VATAPAGDIDHHRLAELMTGSRFEYPAPAKRLHPNKVLEVRGATRVGEFTDVSFVLHSGEVLGLVGLLGAGRTELALALFGMARLDRGEVIVDGEPLRHHSNQDAIRSGIAYLSEDRLGLGLNLRQSVADNISISMLAQLRDAFGFVAPTRRSKLAVDWIARLGIRVADAHDAAQTLSGGNQQRVVLAKWLATRPKVLILDSPTVGVDIRNKQGIYGIIRELANEGVAILLISDEVPEVYLNADKILHMRAGRIVNEFLPSEVSEASVTEAVFG
jgi:simple sugar transport system ATP-binding protein